MSVALQRLVLSPAELSHTPEDVLEMIAAHLKVAEVLTARAVCRHWSQNLSKRYKQFNLPLEVDLSPEFDDWGHKLVSLQKLFPAVQSYQLYVGSHCTQAHLGAYVATLVAAQLTSLQVNYVGPPDAAAGRDLRQPPACMSYLTTLRVLKLHDGKWMGRQSVVRSIRSLTALEQLEDLSITGTLRWNNSELGSGVKIIKAVACLTSLQHLTLQAKDEDDRELDILGNYRERSDSDDDDANNDHEDEDADEDRGYVASDAAVVALTSLSRLQSLRLLDGWLDVSARRLGELSCLSGLSCLHLQLCTEFTEDALHAVAALVTITSLRELDLVLCNDLNSDSALPILEAVSASGLPHVLTGLELRSVCHFPLTTLTQRLARLSRLERLAILDYQYPGQAGNHKWDSLDVLEELSTLRHLSSFTLELSFDATMSEYAVEQLCSTWGTTLTSLHLVYVHPATVSHMVAQLPHLRSLIVRSRENAMMIPLFPWIDTQEDLRGSDKLPLPVGLETLQLQCLYLIDGREVYDDIFELFCAGFTRPDMPRNAQSGDEFDNEPCKAVAGALAQAAEQAVAAGGYFSPSVLAHLLALADGRRGTWQASMHLFQCQSLRHLSLRHSFDDERLLTTLLLSCPNLRSLDLRDVENVTMAVMAVIGLLTDLTSLTLMNDPSRPRDSLKQYQLEGVGYLQNLPYLRTLDLDIDATRENPPTSLLTSLQGLNRLYELRVHGQRRNTRVSLANSLTHVLPCVDVCGAMFQADSENGSVSGDEDEEEEEDEGAEGEDGGEGVWEYEDYVGEDGAGGHDDAEEEGAGGEEEDVNAE